MSNLSIVENGTAIEDQYFNIYHFQSCKDILFCDLGDRHLSSSNSSVFGSNPFCLIVKLNDMFGLVHNSWKAVVQSCTKSFNHCQLDHL